MMLSRQQVKEREEAILAHRFEDGVITSVGEPVEDDRYGHRVDIGQDSTHFLWPLFTNQDSERPMPKVGDIVRLYGGLGYEIEGGDLNGEPVWFETKVAREHRREEWLAETERKKKAAFEANQEEMDAKFEELPDNFKARIRRFRDADPDFRWDSESYEMAPLLHATRLLKHLEENAHEVYQVLRANEAKLLKPEFESLPSYQWLPEHGTTEWEPTLENLLLAWNNLSSALMGYQNKLQDEIVPEEISGNRYHSGNTYGAMISFARRQIIEPGFEC